MKLFLQKWGKFFAIAVFLVVAFFAGNFTPLSKNAAPQVLSASIHVSPTPTPPHVPTVAPVTIINNIIIPTSVPVPLVTTSTPTPIVIIVTPTPTPTNIPTPTLSPTPVPQTVTVAIDYAGEHPADSYTTTITSGENAWQAVQNAVGLANIQYTDYGGSLGIFITGFNGINATSKQYYDFQVNGTSSSVGVSSYTVQANDVLKFVLTND